MTRRAFARDLAALVGSLGLICLPVKAYSRKPALPRRIGVLLVGLSPESKEAHAFRQGLRDAGYEEGRDVVIEWRSASGDYDRIPGLVSDLVQRQVEVIVVENTVAARAIKVTTSTIPVVMVIVADAVGSGLVASLAHPGGNVTGLSMMITELSAKRLELLKESIPRVARVAVLWNPDVPWHANVIENLKAAAPSLSIELSFVSVQTPEQLGPAFSSISRTHAQALYVIADPILYTQRMTLFRLASKARLPVIYDGRRDFVEEGGLLCYGVRYADQMRRSAVYVDKILKGAKPGDLPIEQPTKFELVVNLKTAKVLGITIPQSILLRADEVIR